MIKKILRAYRYIYYRKYTLYIKKIGNKSFPHTSVLYDMITIFTFYLVLLFLMILEFLDIIINFSKIKPLMIIVFVLVYIIHYFYFNYKKKYLLLENEFLNENRKNRIINGWLVTIYSLGSIIFCFIYVLTR